MGNLWSETEQIWEGVFSGIASVLIFIMGIAFLKMDRSRIKWRYKLAVAFEKSHSGSLKDGDEAESQGGKWALFMLPFVTVLREGLEAVVFVGGVSNSLYVHGTVLIIGITSTTCIVYPISYPCRSDIGWNSRMANLPNRLDNDSTLVPRLFNLSTFSHRRWTGVKSSWIL